MSDDLRTIAYRALCLAPSPQLRYQRHARYAVLDGLTCVAWDSPDPTNRVASVLGPSPAPEAVLAQAEQFFAADGDRWGVVVDGTANHPVEAELRARGWTLAQEEPGMVLTPIPPTPLPNLEIRRVCTASDLDRYYAVAAQSFVPENASAPKPEEIDLTRLFIPSLETALDPEIALFTGYAAGEPVAAAGVQQIEGIAEIFGVCVLPAQRRRGYGAAITWAAVCEGGRRGCRAAALSASPMGYPVYLRMGFVEVCRLRTYLQPIAPPTLP